MVRIYILSCILFGSVGVAAAQTNDTNDIQYGISLKTVVDLNLQHPNFNIAVAVAAGAHPFDFSEAYPFVHTGLLLYNKGDLVSSYKKSFFGSTALDFFVSGSLAVGFYSRNVNFDNRFVPLYYFTDFTPTPLQNPFRQSISIGTNFIWVTQQKAGERFQRVGFTGLMVDRRFQISTYNDGSIWAKLKIGDGLDRYYTGGGMVSYHLDNQNELSALEFSFHKFTGHERYAFDIANQLQIDFIPFKDPETYFYNKNRFRLTLSSFKNDYGVHVTLHNVDRDPQDWIHFKGGNTYHPDIFSDKKGMPNELNRIAIGGFWNTMDSKFTN